MPKIVTIFFLLVFTLVLFLVKPQFTYGYQPNSNCPDLPTIPISIEPTSGNQTTQFKVTVLWESLATNQFNAYKDLDIYIRAFKSGDATPITTTDTIDSYYGRQQKNSTHILSNFFTATGNYQVYVKLGIEQFSRCNGYEANSTPIQITVQTSSTGLNPGDKCDPNLKNGPTAYRCPASAPCTRRGLTEEYFCSIAAGRARTCKDPTDKTFDKNIDMACTTSAGEFCDGTSGIKTAIGCIHTEPKAFIEDLMKFILGIGGGIAFLLMLIGVFEMITSAGNPERLKSGTDRFTSAIIGILFIVFSVLFMQIIGVDILGILPK